MNELLLLILVMMGILLRFTPPFFFIFAGALVIFHPLLLMRGYQDSVEVISNIIFILIVAGGLLLFINAVLKRSLSINNESIQIYFITKRFEFILSFGALVILFLIPFSLWMTITLLIIAITWIWDVHIRILIGALLALFISSIGLTFVNNPTAMEVMARMEFIVLTAFVVLSVRKNLRKRGFDR